MSKKGPYKIGDIVKLKSGGPDMTVRDENIHYSTGKLESYTCQWFAGKKLEKGSFPPDSLEPVGDNSDS
jgi:uncharacterized protein YodC (DUF2158 family)